MMPVKMFLFYSGMLDPSLAVVVGKWMDCDENPATFP